MTTEKSITELLAVKHAEDIFVPQCKTGPTQCAEKGSLLILDAWAMRRSWTNPLTTGYEIKVNRNDFLSDRKWRRYLNFCDQFYFICPTGVIKPEELPAEAGLRYVSKTGTKIFTKKKAPVRDVKLDEWLVKYILIIRSAIANERKSVSNKAYWEDWLKQKERDVDFGWRVGKAIKETIEKKIHEVGRENNALWEENEMLVSAKKTLEKMGIDIADYFHWSGEARLRERIEEIEKGIPDGSLSEYLDSAIENLTRIKKVMER